MSERSVGGARVFLSWAIGLFALISGIQELSAWNSGIGRFGRDMADLFGSSSSSLGLIFAIGKIIVGVILIAAPLNILHEGVARVLVTIVVLFWLVVAVVELFFWGRPFQPEVLVWLKSLAFYVILISGSWQVRRSLA